jgi:hypothetical protein
MVDSYLLLEMLLWVRHDMRMLKSVLMYSRLESQLA